MTEYVKKGYKRKIDLDQATALYRAGYAFGEIGAFFGATRNAAHLALVKAGVHKGGRHPAQPKTTEVPAEERRRLAREAKNAKDEWWKALRMKNNARSRTMQAIADGRLIPQPCEVCGWSGRLPNGNRGVQAHHDDYSRPLDVRWLCPEHQAHWHSHNKTKW